MEAHEELMLEYGLKKKKDILVSLLIVWKYKDYLYMANVLSLYFLKVWKRDIKELKMQSLF